VAPRQRRAHSRTLSAPARHDRSQRERASRSRSKRRIGSAHPPWRL
jgi:hypothetical protein